MLSRLAPLGGPRGDLLHTLMQVLMCVFLCVCVCVCSAVSDSVTQLCLTLWPREPQPVHGISQARILEWVSIFFSRGSSWSKDRTRDSHTSCICRQILYHCTTWEAIASGRCLWSWHALVCRCICLISASFITWYSPCVCMSVSKFPSYKCTGHCIRDHSDPVRPLLNLITSAKTLFPNKVRFSWCQELGLESVFWRQNSTHHTFFPMVSGPMIITVPKLSQSESPIEDLGNILFFPPFLSSFILLLFNKYLSIYLLGCAGSHGLSCPTVCGILSSPARGGTHDPCIGRQILNQWTTRKVSILALCLRQLWPSCWSSWVQPCREGCLRGWSPGAEKSREKRQSWWHSGFISRLISLAFSHEPWDIFEIISQSFTA